MAPNPRSGRDGRHLARVLRTGTFAEALDAAITARGLTLDQLRFHLAERGVTISQTTLSYWRRNRSRPERGASLRALGELEALLGLPASSLVVLLGPPRPRGRWLNGCDRDYLWPSEAPVMTQLGAEPQGRFEILSTYDVVTVAADRSELRVRCRPVMRALRHLIDRCVIFYQAEDTDPDQEPPEVVATRFCSVDRVRYDPHSRLLVAELLLDRTLRAGEDTIIEYEFRFAPGRRRDYFHTRFHYGSREYVLQTEFLGAAPTRCDSYRRLTCDGPDLESRPVPIGSSNTALLVERDVPPGVCGMRWEW
ncbi:hypothetical protein AB0M43_07230 [Longispora sp. NPDC051575]|uniref:hypothetical protein n=1 Tax=Longispora sp. NPDC051575 TaxID=3154943 RepID=UPI0034356D2B